MIRLKIKEYAQARGLTQGALGRAANVDDKTIRAIYHNPHHYVSTEVLDKIAQALQIDVSCLLENDPPLPQK